MNHETMRIGFRYIHSGDWQGGYNYLLNLCRGLKQQGEIQPVVFLGFDAPESDVQRFRSLLEDNMVYSTAFSPEQLSKRRWRTLVSGCDKLAEQEFQKNQVDVVFENADFYGKAFAIPTIAWIPDFQHRHLPQMFSRWAYWKRDIGFRAQIRSGRQIMVSSEDAKSDCQRFYGVPDSQIHVVRFAVPLEHFPTPEQRESARQKYDLPPDYFLLPNQFWRHKNHEILVDALSLLRGSDRCPTVAVTGGASHPTCVDVRNSLENRVKRADLEDHLRLLGRIPYPDLVGLLGGCRALINPSRFEGWSTTIEEAKSFGIRMVLSNLAVHREQVPHHGLFFDPDRPEELAQCLVEATTQEPLATDEQSLKEDARSRVESFVAQFVKLVRNCHSQHLANVAV